jgi:hypothetical protein
VLLGEAAALLSALTISPWETAREIRTLGRRRRHLWSSDFFGLATLMSPIVSRYLLLRGEY